MVRSRDAPIQVASFHPHVKDHQVRGVASHLADVSSFIVQLSMPNFEINSPSECLSRDPNKLSGRTVVAETNPGIKGDAKIFS